MLVAYNRFMISRFISTLMMRVIHTRSEMGVILWIKVSWVIIKIWSIELPKIIIAIIDCWMIVIIVTRDYVIWCRIQPDRSLIVWLVDLGWITLMQSLLIDSWIVIMVELSLNRQLVHYVHWDWIISCWILCWVWIERIMHVLAFWLYFGFTQLLNFFWVNLLYILIHLLLLKYF